MIELYGSLLPGLDGVPAGIGVIFSGTGDRPACCQRAALVVWPRAVERWELNTDGGGLVSDASLPIPLHGAPQAFLEIYFGFVVEGGFGFRDVGEGVFDVAAALGGVLGLSAI
jgi:hypothetical protein